MNVNNRDIRRWLSSYRILKHTVKLKEDNLREFISEIYNPLRTRARRLVRVDDRLEAATDEMIQKMDAIYDTIISELHSDIEKMSLTMREIYSAINSLRDYEQVICFDRYVIGLSWSSIADKLGYDARQCQRYEANAIRRLMPLYLNFVKINNSELTRGDVAI